MPGVQLACYTSIRCSFGGSDASKVFGGKKSFYTAFQVFVDFGTCLGCVYTYMYIYIVLYVYIFAILVLIGESSNSPYQLSLGIFLVGAFSQLCQNASRKQIRITYIFHCIAVVSPAFLQLWTVNKWSFGISGFLSVCFAYHVHSHKNKNVGTCKIR